MGARPPRAIGQFGWIDADVGVECGACGLVQIYCDFEAVAAFRERGWSLNVEDAALRFRCRCGSRNVRLRPVMIGMRPKPLPTPPSALRPIYREDGRTLFRRGPSAFPDPQQVDAALVVLTLAVEQRDATPPREALDQALAVIRPHCYMRAPLDSFCTDLDRMVTGLFCGQAARGNLTAIVRQLGKN